MKKILMIITVVVVQGGCIMDVFAQKLDHQQRMERMDSVLATRYYRTSYDTNFVVRPEGKLLQS